jgi:hypothetical protein
VIAADDDMLRRVVEGIAIAIAAEDYMRAEIALLTQRRAEQLAIQRHNERVEAERNAERVRRLKFRVDVEEDDEVNLLDMDPELMIEAVEELGHTTPWALQETMREARNIYLRSGESAAQLAWYTIYPAIRETLGVAL